MKFLNSKGKATKYGQCCKGAINNFTCNITVFHSNQIFKVLCSTIIIGHIRLGGKVLVRKHHTSLSLRKAQEKHYMRIVVY